MRDNGGYSSFSSDDEESEPSRLQKIEQSKAFQCLVTGVILLNTLLMACEANSRERLPIYDVLDNAFLSIFVAEISFRLLVYQCGFFTDNKERFWNLFDFTIVMVGILDWIIWPLLVETNKDKDKVPRLGIFFRVLRILRVLRAFRLFREFKKLRILGLGLIDSLQSVVWVAVMFLLVMFVYATIITSLAGRNWAEFEDKDDQDTVRDRFGTILNSMETLFLFLTLDDWSSPARVVNKRYPLMELVWISYIVIGAFTLLSLLTGLMADKMNQVRTQEEEKETHQKAAELDVFIRELKVLFNKADTSGDAKVNAEEFQQMVCRKRVAERMQQWGVPIIKETEAQEIFRALDRSQDGELSWHEFRDGLLQLSRPFKAKDIMWLEGSVFRLDRILRKKEVQNPGIAWDLRLNRVHARASLILERLGILERDLAEFFHVVGYRPPP